MLRRIVRWPWVPRSVTEADVAALMDARVAVDPEHESRTRALFKDVPAAESFPAYREVYLDRQGRIWVGDLDGVDLTSPNLQLTSWLVFDSGGRLIARAALGRALGILDLGDDYVLGVELDDLDVEHVRMYGLMR